MSFQWQNPNAFWLLQGVLVLAAVIIWKAHHTEERFPWRHFLIVTLGFCIGIAGLARPQWGQRMMSKQGLRSQIYLAIDISRSMLAEDIPPSRLGFAIAFSQRLLRQLSGARVALFPFAIDGYLQMPLTTDLTAISDILGALTPSMTTAQGTDISTSLSTLLRHISRSDQMTQDRGEEPLPTQVILLTDGESHVNLRTDVLREYRNRHIPIFTIGTGTSNGTSVPAESRWGFTKESLKDSAGKTVLSRLDAGALKRVAEATGGDFFPARFDDVYALRQRLTQSMKYGKLSTTFRVEKEFYPQLFTVVFGLFLLEFLSGRWQFAIRSIVWFLAFFAMSAVPAFGEGDDPERKGNPETIAADLYNDALTTSKKDLPQAMEQLQEALSLTRDPDLRKSILFNLGNAFLKAGDPVQAIQSYQQSHDARANDPKLEELANERTSDNLVLAQRILEEQKKQEQSGKGQTKQQGEGQGQPNDQNGPQKNYSAQPFSDEQKQKMYNLLSSEEQHILARLQEEKNRKNPHAPTGKTW